MLDADEATTATVTARRLVYIVDDEAGVRLALTDMIEDMGYAPWPFASGLDLLAALGKIDPGCLLLDMRMPGMVGIEVMDHLRCRECDWPVVVMTAHGDVPSAVQAMKLGALEFIEKPFPAALLKPALARGFETWDRQAAKRAVRDAARDRLNALTPREQNVLNALVEGKQNKIVAFNLGLSVRTVEMHRANLLNKLGLRTPQEAVALLARAGRGIDPPAF